MLSLLLSTPLLGIVLLLPLKNIKIIKILGFTITAIIFIMTLRIWDLYEYNMLGYQFLTGWNIFSEYSIYLGIDGLSIYFILLTGFLMPVVLLSSWSGIKYSIKSYTVLIVLLEFVLLTLLSVLDIFSFYIFFEATLPILFILIGIWGSKNKIKASYEIFLYTFIGSLFMLLGFITLYNITGSSNYENLVDQHIYFYMQLIIWICIFLAILVKTPLVPMHIWLLLCHAEASLGGSIILAGIILKLALYAILRILIPILPEASSYFTPLVFTICVITIFHASLSTIRQIDMKMLIANSSIAHMGIVIMGAFSNTLIGIEGSVLLGIAHGICSPLLFILLGGYLYERYHTRLILYYRGLNQVMPLFSIIFFIASLANCGVPLTLNYLGEFMSLSGSIFKLPFLGSLAAISILLSAVYSFYLYNRLTGGNLSPYLKSPGDLTRREFFVSLPLIVSLILLGIFPNVILEGLHLSCSTVLYTL